MNKSDYCDEEGKCPVCRRPVCETSGLGHALNHPKFCHDDSRCRETIMIVRGATSVKGADHD